MADAPVRARSRESLRVTRQSQDDWLKRKMRQERAVGRRGRGEPRCSVRARCAGAGVKRDSQSLRFGFRRRGAKRRGAANGIALRRGNALRKRGPKKGREVDAARMFRVLRSSGRIADAVRALVPKSLQQSKPLGGEQG
jgi:hypothetical protein